MRWNWQKKEWPNFRYNRAALDELEEQFLHTAGILIGTGKHIGDEDKNFLLVDYMSDEALNTSKIEGEILMRESLQSAIRRNLGLGVDNKKVPPAEQGIAEMMVALYHTFNKPL